MATDYNYEGVYVPVDVKVVKFYNMADFIFSFSEWKQEGGWRGLIKGGAFNLRDVECVITGKMSPVDFDNLPAWEG